MRKNYYHLFAIGLGALLLPQFAQAQPTGSIIVTVTTNAVWDVNGLNFTADYTITKQHNEHTSTVSVSYPFTPSQSGGGAISGLSDSTPITLAVNGANADFTGKVKLHGSVTSSHGKGHVLFSGTASGSTDLEGRPRHVSSTHVMSLKFDNSLLTATGTERDSAAAAGLGIVSQHEDINEPLSSVFTGDGSWTLALSNLSTSGKKVTGTATVSLNSGQVLSFNVNGLFTANKGTAKLTLTAANKKDASTKGSTLQVGISANNTISSIKGRLSGQAVNVTFAPSAVPG